MPTILRLVLAVVAGLFAGSMVNMGLIVVGGSVIPPPAGADVSTAAGLQASLHLFEPRHFIFPFLAHGLGTVAGAALAALLAPARGTAAAYAVGVLFLCAGVANVLMLPAPAWFEIADLALAYLPAAWLGRRLAAALAAPREHRA